MPVSVKFNPFRSEQEKATPSDSTPDLALRTTHARALHVLMPADPTDPPIDWPLFTRAVLATKMGYTTLSGTLTRALNGIKSKVTKSGPPHPGLIDRGMIVEVVLDIEGTKETSYRITELGIRAYRAHVAKHGEELPKQRNKSSCINDRYKDSPPEKENLEKSDGKGLT